MKYLSMITLILALIVSTPLSSGAEENVSNQQYIGFYNGINQSTLKYSIGTSSTVDKIKWGKSNVPILSPREGLFDGWGLNGAFPIQIGEQIFVYYSGNNGTAWNGIGVAIFTKDLHLVSRPRQPILSMGDTGSWDDSKIFRPIVMINDASTDPTKKYIMYYTGADNKGINKGGIAYSADGLNWTKYHQNPVMSNGSAGDFDSLWAMPEYIIKKDSLYYMVYKGYNGKNVETGLATSENLDGPWNKHSTNPIVKSRSSAKQNLISDAKSGEKTIKVADSSVFELDEPSYLSSNSGTENVRIKSKPDSTTIELYEPVILDHSKSGNASIKSVVSHSVGPNQLEYDGKTWRLYGSSWGVVKGYETTTLAEGPSLDELQWSFSNMPTLNYDTVVTQDWDSQSQENLKFIQIK